MNGDELVNKVNPYPNAFACQLCACTCAQIHVFECLTLTE